MSTFISEPGTRLGGRYRLEDRTAAAGGWAAWKAIDEILARPVTVVTFEPGFAHLCLQPGSLRWTPNTGVKIVGLGVDAALTGITSEDPAADDTRGLASL